MQITLLGGRYYEKACRQICVDRNRRGKGQIVIPKQAREVFDIHPGDNLVLLGDESRGLAIPSKCMFAQFAAAVFETGHETKGEE